MSKPPLSLYREFNGVVFTSGQVYLTEERKLLEGGVKEKTKQIMDNLEKILTAAGVSFNDVLKTTIYVTDMSVYEEVNEVYAEYFGSEFPAREVIGVKELPLGATIEISMVAGKGE